MSTCLGREAHVMSKTGIHDGKLSCVKFLRWLRNNMQSGRSCFINASEWVVGEYLFCQDRCSTLWCRLRISLWLVIVHFFKAKARPNVVGRRPQKREGNVWTQNDVSGGAHDCSRPRLKCQEYSYHGPGPIKIWSDPIKE